MSSEEAIERERRHHEDSREHERRRYEAAEKEKERVHERLTTLEVEAAKASTQTGSLTARMIMIINGGAAAGLLAFLGTLAGKCPQAISGVAGHLVWFAGGVALGAATMAFGFTANFCDSVLLRWERAKDRRYYWWRRGSRSSKVLSMVAGALGLGVFVYGVFGVAEELKKVGNQIKVECSLFIPFQ